MRQVGFCSHSLRTTLTALQRLPLRKSHDKPLCNEEVYWLCREKVKGAECVAPGGRHLSWPVAFRFPHSVVQSFRRLLDIIPHHDFLFQVQCFLTFSLKTVSQAS